jgi:DNA replication licensing factor MCM6
LCEAIEAEMVRFDPFLRQAVQQFMLQLHPSLDRDATTVYFVALHNVPHQLAVRDLKTDSVGRLVAVSGTVTRTSDVRPELLVATFSCNKCGLLAENVQQQYHYTYPTICRNPRCQNRSNAEFALEIRSSEFVDWQKLRVQENSDEIPPGSMPRSIDIIVRNEMVEKAKAGDKCVFTGSMVVIPDGSALARAGDAVQASSNRVRPNDAATGGGGGVRGIKALGVKELTYRTCFVASSVIQMEMALRTKEAGTSSNMVASFLFGKHDFENEDPTMQEVAMEFTEEERNDIRNMKSSPHLYERVSLCGCVNSVRRCVIVEGLYLHLHPVFLYSI